MNEFLNYKNTLEKLIQESEDTFIELGNSYTFERLYYHDLVDIAQDISEKYFFENKVKISFGNSTLQELVEKDLQEESRDCKLPAVIFKLVLDKLGIPSKIVLILNGAHPAVYFRDPTNGDVTQVSFLPKGKISQQSVLINSKTFQWNDIQAWHEYIEKRKSYNIQMLDNLDQEALQALDRAYINSLNIEI